MNVPHEPAKGIFTPACSLASRGLELVAAAVLFFLMVFQFSEVIARYLFNRPIPGSQDIIGFTLGIAIFVAMPVVTWQRTHITVPILEQHFRGWVRYCTRLLAILATGAAFAAVSYGAFRRAETATKYGVVTEDLELKLAPIWYLLSALALLAVVLLLDRLWCYLRDWGDPPGPPGRGGLGQ